MDCTFSLKGFVIAFFSPGHLDPLLPLQLVHLHEEIVGRVVELLATVHSVNNLGKNIF